MEEETVEMEACYKKTQCCVHGRDMRLPCIDCVKDDEWQHKRLMDILSHPAYLKGYQSQNLRFAKMEETVDIYNVSEMD